MEENKLYLPTWEEVFVEIGKLLNIKDIQKQEDKLEELWHQHEVLHKDVEDIKKEMPQS